MSGEYQEDKTLVIEASKCFFLPESKLSDRYEIFIPQLNQAWEAAKGYNPNYLFSQERMPTDVQVIAPAIKALGTIEARMVGYGPTTPTPVNFMYTRDLLTSIYQSNKMDISAEAPSAEERTAQQSAILRARKKGPECMWLLYCDMRRLRYYPPMN